MKSHVLIRKHNVQRRISHTCIVGERIKEYITMAICNLHIHKRGIFFVFFLFSFTREKYLNTQGRGARAQGELLGIDPWEKGREHIYITEIGYKEFCECWRKSAVVLMDSLDGN